MKILYILIGLAVLGGGAWFVMQQRSGVAQEASRAEESDSSMDEAGAFRGSLQDLMARSGAWQCDVSMTTEGITSSGTTYVSGGKVRADFTSTIPQVGEVQSHMIIKDNTAYTWTSMMNRGFKFPIQGAEVEPEVSAEVAAQINQDYDYSCRVWSVDESKFALPSGITF